MAPPLKFPYGALDTILEHPNIKLFPAPEYDERGGRIRSFSVDRRFYQIVWHPALPVLKAGNLQVLFAYVKRTNTSSYDNKQRLQFYSHDNDLIAFIELEK